MGGSFFLFSLFSVPLSQVMGWAGGSGMPPLSSLSLLKGVRDLMLSVLLVCLRVSLPDHAVALGSFQRIRDEVSAFLCARSVWRHPIVRTTEQRYSTCCNQKGTRQGREEKERERGIFQDGSDMDMLVRV